MLIVSATALWALRQKGVDGESKSGHDTADDNAA